MKHTCTECGISYSADMEACPWCGHVRLTDLASDQAEEVPAAGSDVPSARDAMSDSELAAPADLV
ncbi:MAG: hypothetical protein OEM22_08010, partial [Acidimicrobiia bacterium]|nr:hypothetical protein [Acidimicrobiia bacterium]